MITNVEITDATTNDVEMTPAIHQHLSSRRLAAGEHVADAGYISAGHILTARADHGITLPGRVCADTRQTRRSAGSAPQSSQTFRIVSWQQRSMSASRTPRRYFVTKIKWAWSAETTCLPRR